ncbi:hypothetical protein JQ633_00980 [Bradyrhizobium tropiciagri]|nr:hypothetical protein [Bradyrhizobium tropiciagri]MBR0868914.1 hypothetical protein [Bradyrhizobium tropiciagri]
MDLRLNANPAMQRREWSVINTAKADTLNDARDPFHLATLHEYTKRVF